MAAFDNIALSGCVIRDFRTMAATMPAPNLSETNALIAVLENRSFTKAAEQLGLSPTRVSELVRKVEDRLGVRLVERTTRAVAPTVAGERLLERLRPVLQEYQAAFDVADEFRSRPAGTLRLTVAPPAAEYVMASAIAAFLSQYPEITLDISADAALTDIVAARYDAGVRPEEFLPRDMIAVRISDEMPIVVVGAPKYFASRDKPKSPQDLANHDCIRFRLPSRAMFPWRFRVKRRPVELHVDGRLIGDNPKMLIKAAVDGAGLVQIPTPYVAAELEAGQFATVLDEFAPTPLDGFFLYYPSRRQIRPPLKAFVDFMRGQRRGT